MQLLACLPVCCRNQLTVVNIDIIYNLISMVLEKCGFLYVDVGCNGQASDGDLWRDCSFAKRLEAEETGLQLTKTFSTDTSCFCRR